MKAWTLVPAAVLVPAVALLLQQAPPPEPPGNVPIGTILAWWGEHDKLPPGFELCDGKQPEDREALFKFRKPDLRGQFLRGADTPQSFNPRADEGNGQDTVTLDLPDDAMLQEDQLPPHVHPMPHVHTIGNHAHAIGAHVHVIAEDIELDPKDPPADAHTHEIPDHDHDVPLHGHTSQEHSHTITVPVAKETALVNDAVFNNPGETSVLIQTATNTPTTNAATVLIDDSPATTTAGLADSTATDTGKGDGFTATEGLETGAGNAPTGLPVAQTNTGQINGTAETGENDSKQQPIELGEVEFDNRPAYFDVLWIIRVR
jgi:hypothetical protein